MQHALSGRPRCCCCNEPGRSRQRTRTQPSNKRHAKGTANDFIFCISLYYSDLRNFHLPSITYTYCSTRDEQHDGPLDSHIRGRCAVVREFDCSAYKTIQSDLLRQYMYLSVLQNIMSALTELYTHFRFSRGFALGPSSVVPANWKNASAEHPSRIWME